MRKMMVGALVGSVLLAAAATFAAEPAKSHEATGTVKSIDAKARTVVLDTGSATETFLLSSYALIEQSSPHKTLSLNDLKVGERVRVDYTMNGNDRRASKVEVLETKVASASTKPKS